MEKIVKEGKEEKEILTEILADNKLKEEDVIYTSTVKKGGLFKGNIVEVTLYKKEDIYNEIKEYLKDLTKGLGLETTFEIKNKEDHPVIKMYSNNNSILIGREGQTLKSLEVMVRQMLLARFGIKIKIALDVENYKDKKQSILERLAKKTAKEVASTKVEAHLENMTSYERRIVHNALTNFKGVITESEGEEPHRHVVIKPSK